jgi:hypothetical protein
VLKSEWCRERAADCAKLAATATDQGAKATLDHMSGAWLRLAFWHEQRSVEVALEGPEIDQT